MPVCFRPEWEVDLLADSCVDGWLSIIANIGSSCSLFKDDFDDSSLISLLVGKENIEQTPCSELM